MNIKITSKNGVTLNTANKYVKEDIAIVLDESFAQPSGTLEITEKGEYDVKNIEKVNVNIESGSGTDMLQTLIDTTKSCDRLFQNYTGDNVDFISGLDTSSVINMEYMFASCSKLTSIPQLNTSSVTNMEYMFSSCKSLTTIPQLDTSNVNDMQYMFNQCTNLTTIPQLDTSSVYNMPSMFYYCSNLTSIPQLDTSNVYNIKNMFKNCKVLETIDITYYNVSSTSYSTYFVNGCTALKSLIIRSFGTSYVLDTNSFTNSGIAKGTGYIYVPSSMVDTLKSATNWSTYASQIRALEDYTIDGTTAGALDETKI